PPRPSSSLDRVAARLPRRAVPHGGGRRAPEELLAGAFAGAPLRTLDHFGGRQGRGLHGRGRRTPLSRRAWCAGKPHQRSRRHPSWLRPSDPPGARRRGGATRLVRVVEAGHPMPDAAGLAATVETLDLADSAGAEDLVLVLISGGASANWIAPAAGLSLADKQAATRALLACGASIVEINTVRKHLSRIKGGRLAQHAYPARLVAVGISAVPGDHPTVIGSSPPLPPRTPPRPRRPASHRCSAARAAPAARPPAAREAGARPPRQ